MTWSCDFLTSVCGPYKRDLRRKPFAELRSCVMALSRPVASRFLLSRFLLVSNIRALSMTCFPMFGSPWVLFGSLCTTVAPSRLFVRVPFPRMRWSPQKEERTSSQHPASSQGVRALHHRRRSRLPPHHCNKLVRPRCVVSKCVITLCRCKTCMAQAGAVGKAIMSRPQPATLA